MLSLQSPCILVRRYCLWSTSLSDLPFDCESSHSGFLGKNVSSDPFDDGLGWRLILQFLTIVLIVDVISDSYKLPSIIRACQENNCDTDDFGRWESFHIRRVCFEDKLVHPDRYGANEERVELLIVFCRGCRANIGEFPFEVCDECQRDMLSQALRSLPFRRCSMHSKVISKLY